MASFHGNDPDSIRRRLAEIAEVEASRRHVLLGAVGGMLASLAISLLIMAWGFSMHDPGRGPLVLWGGALVGNVGILLTLLWAHSSSDG
jgi:hypothetical protein